MLEGSSFPLHLALCPLFAHHLDEIAQEDVSVHVLFGRSAGDVYSSAQCVRVATSCREAFRWLACSATVNLFPGGPSPLAMVVWTIMMPNLVQTTSSSSSITWRYEQSMEIHEHAEGEHRAQSEAATVAGPSEQAEGGNPIGGRDKNRTPRSLHALWHWPERRCCWVQEHHDG